MKKPLFLSDIIKGAAHGNKYLSDDVRNYINEEIDNAISITFDDLKTFEPIDGDSFVIPIEKDIDINLKSVVLPDKKFTIIFRGTGKPSNVVKTVMFPGGKKYLHDKDPLLIYDNQSIKESIITISDGAVLILENVILRTKHFIYDCIIQLNGGILILKNSMLINEDDFEFRCSSDQNCTDECWFVTNFENVGYDTYVIQGNDKSILCFY